MGRPQKVTNDQILATTRRLFSKRGSAVPLSEIASELGVSAPALIGRFGTKENLILASVGHARSEAWAKAIRDREVDDRPLAEHLREIWQQSVELIRDGLPVMAGLVHSDLRSALEEDEETSPPAFGERVIQEWLDRVPSHRKSSALSSAEIANLLLISAEGAALRAWLFPNATPETPDVLIRLISP